MIYKEQKINSLKLKLTRKFIFYLKYYYIIKYFIYHIKFNNNSFYNGFLSETKI
jgi:hypothetical protein